MKNTILPVTLFLAIGCADGNSRTNTCGAGVQGLVRDDVAQKGIDLTRAPGGLLTMKAENSERPESYCNSFPVFNAQTDSFLMFSGVHCFGSTKQPQGEFFLSKKKGYLKAELKEVFREKIKNAIQKLEPIGPKTVAVFKDRLTYSQSVNAIEKCGLSGESINLSSAALSAYSVACFSGSDLRVAQVKLNPEKKFAKEFEKLKTNKIELGPIANADGFEHQKAFATIALAREHTQQSSAVLSAMKKLALAMQSDDKDPDLIKELASPAAQKSIIDWEWENLAPLIGLREMDKSLAASAVVPQQLMTFKEFEEFARNSTKINALQTQFQTKSRDYDTALYNLAKKNVKTDHVKVKFTVNHPAKAGGVETAETMFLDLGKAVTLDKLSESEDLGIQFDDENKAILLLVRKREKNQLFTFQPTDSGSALMGDDGVIALTLVTYDGLPVEGIVRPPIGVEPHIETTEVPPAMANDKDKKPGKTNTQATPPKQNEGGFFGDIAGAFAKVLRPEQKVNPQNTTVPSKDTPKISDDSKPGKPSTDTSVLTDTDRGGQIAMADERSNSDSTAQKGGSTTLGIKSCN